MASSTAAPTESFDPTQHRGSREAYERYLKGMDASMRQKVALTAAHLLCTGRVADMGMGSGAGSEALAALYPMLNVVGVDLDPTMVEMAREKFRLPNLTFEVGDIAEAIFENESLDGIFDSSVLHHVTSFGNYEHPRAARCLSNQAKALKAHGVLVVRDFLAPKDERVVIGLPDTDGDATENPRTCSTWHRFARFAKEFRSLHETPGFAFEELAAERKGWRRAKTTLRLATEFVLRKDYRTDWEAEAKEEYAYFTQREFEALFTRLGLRVLASTPLRNPWIVRNRFVGQVDLSNEAGSAIEWPATNYVIAGEKVRDGEGVHFHESGAVDPVGFLEMSHYKNLTDGRVRDLVRRPHTSIDVVPYFDIEGDLFVVARMSYPRPILASTKKSTALDESTPPHYVTEPLNVLQIDKPLGQTVEEMLVAHAKIASSSIRQFRFGSTYYPSPGGSQEEVRSMLVEIEPVLVEEHIPNASGFSTSGRIRALEAEQVLRSAQVGGLPDARVELNVYDLMLQLGRSPGAWIGEAIAPTGALASERVLSADDARKIPSRRAFERVKGAKSRFLALQSARFNELDANGNAIASGSLEYVVPETLSTNTMVCALLSRVGGEICIGVDDDDLPAAQCFVGNSDLFVAPAWRLPKSVLGMSEAREWVRNAIRKEFDLSLGETWELGGAYYPSAGMSPEVVFPIAVDVTAIGNRRDGRRLRWLSLREFGTHLSQFRDGHLRIVALRAAHALGLLQR